MSEADKTLHAKLCILHDLDAGSKFAAVAVKYGIGVFEVFKIYSERAIITEIVNVPYYERSKELELQQYSRNPNMEKKLYSWLMDKKQQGHKVYRSDVRNKALEFFDVLQEKDHVFKATSNWLSGFQKRFNIPTFDDARGYVKSPRANPDDNFVGKEDIIVPELAMDQSDADISILALLEPECCLQTSFEVQDGNQADLSLNSEVSVIFFSNLCNDDDF